MTVERVELKDVCIGLHYTNVFYEGEHGCSSSYDGQPDIDRILADAARWGAGKVRKIVYIDGIGR